MTDIEKRLDRIRQQKAKGRAQAADELAQLAKRLADAKNEITELDATRKSLSAAVEVESQRITKLCNRVTFAIVLLALAAVLFLGLIGKFSNHMIEDARTEAARIRMENAQDIAEARSEGEAALQSLTQQMKGREVALFADIEALGADLAQISADRDSARAELERFAELRQQIGFELVPYRNRVMIVVNEGETITGWRAPGLSNLARYNGRMFRVVQAD